jgi:hypothetical protein
LPAPLPITTVPVKWRIEEEDLDLLRLVYGEGRVNAKVRDLIHAHCEAIRGQLMGGQRLAGG